MVYFVVTSNIIITFGRFPCSSDIKRLHRYVPIHTSWLKIKVNKITELNNAMAIQKQKKTGKLETTAIVLIPVKMTVG